MITNEQKKEILQDFLNQCWQRSIYLFEESAVDYDYSDVKHYLQDDDEIIDWYVSNFK